jgi:ATP-dependent RNA helicase RhlE
MTTSFFAKRQNRNRFRPAVSGRGFGQSPRGFNKKIKTMDPRLLVPMAAIDMPQEEYISTHQFSDFEISEILKTNIQERGYTYPTPIQDQAIPAILNGRDVVGIANTGTGKTAAFLLPLLQQILVDRNKRALIVAPTRELAVQILDECREFSKGLNIVSTLCIGGVNIRPQAQSVRRNPGVIIGTPGRLRDLNKQGDLRFSNYSNIVLDEVDRMLDMGFIHDVKNIISKLPDSRQSLFFSATLSPEIKSIMNSFLNDPVIVSVKTRETALNVDQDVIKVNGQLKIDMLHDLLVLEEFRKVLIFSRTKRGVEKLADQLLDRGFKVAALHGNKNQSQRQRALEEFKGNRVSILLATDIASRGLDIPDITHVVNYDLPETYEDYVHRIGRTGRAGNKGFAISFVD